MKDLINILKNKRVVLVGPAPYLQEKKRGEIIDKYDIVCGVGSTFNLNDEDYGNRIDILFSTTNDLSIRDIHIDNIINKNIKYIIGTNKRNKTKNLNNYNKFCNIINKISNQNVKCFNISDYTTKLEAKCCKCSIQQAINHDGLHTGSFAICYLLNLPIKELRIEGMTFYNSGKFGYIHNKDYHLDKHHFLNGNSHPMLKIQDEISFVKNIIKQSKIPISYDDKYLKL